MRFVGHGHERIRATHTKTLELSLDPDITERATCVIAVNARPEPHRPRDVAPTARQALEWLASAGCGVCALVTDLHLPAMDGFQLIERVRADSRNARLPIVVLSGDTDPRTPERIYRLGANAYFVKPYSPAQVRQRVEQLLDAYSPLHSP